MRLQSLLTTALLFTFATGALAAEKDAPKEVALGYLKALAGKGDDSAREYLLGDVTLTAGDFSIPNYKIKSRDKARVEIKSVKAALKAMRKLDSAGANALDNIMDAAENSNEMMATVTQEQANKMMAPTQKVARDFENAFPVFALCARADKDVYWNPSNPWRALVDELGTSGKYKLEFHKFNIVETKGKNTRVWPLRVLRMRTKTYDSGWKILPASDWDPDY